MNNKLLRSAPAFAERYGPWALIAGGTEGMGREFTFLAAEMGLHTAVVGRRTEKLRQIAEELKTNTRVSVRPIEADLSSSSGIEKIISETRDLDIGLLIYNACKSLIGSFLAYGAEEHREIINTNCMGPMLLTRHFGEIMTGRKRGGVILMSSMSGLQGTPLVAGYAATKAYNLNLAQSLWKEFKPCGVDVLGCVAGATLTPNYIHTKPKDGKSSAPEMEPGPVVREAFSKLGKQPYMVPGLKNKMAVFFLRRCLGKKGGVNMVAKNMYRQYGEPEIPS